MKTVGIKVLKNKLSEYVRVAAAGETVQVTDRGKVVAELVPPRTVADTPEAPEAPELTDAERQWAELIRQGHVTPAKNPRPKLVPAPPAIMTLEEMLRDLDERWRGVRIGIGNSIRKGRHHSPAKVQRRLTLGCN